MTIVEAIKALYVKCGGTGSDYTAETISEGLALLKDVLIGADLPTVTASNNGQVLTVSGGEWTAANPATELPAVTTDDNGDILVVSAGAWAKGAMPVELPAVTKTDEGKVLTVNSSGEWVAAELPS